MGNKHAECALCPYEWSERYCRKENGKAPKNCPSTNHPELIAEALAATKSQQVCEFARQASIQEAEAYGNRGDNYASVYPIKPRIAEVMEFAQKMHYHRLALVFCVGLRREAAIVHKLFKNHGFDVVSVSCKVGRVSKGELGLEEHQKIVPNSFESMCNPVLQAKLANHYGSQFNVLLGLCVGHDSLFFKHAEAPTTVLAVKDRLLGHNPLAAVYQTDAYYRYLKTPRKA